MLSRIINWPLVVAFILTMLLWIVFVRAAPVHAQGYHCWSLDGCPRHYRRRPHHEGPRLYRAPELDNERGENGFHCLGPVRGLGTQWIGQAGALEAAKKDWMERVRFDHGERYIDFANARGFVDSCSRVSIGEVVGQVTFRCEIWAVPCRPPIKFDPAATAKDEARQEKQDDLLEQKQQRDVERMKP